MSLRTIAIYPGADRVCQGMEVQESILYADNAFQISSMVDPPGLRLTGQADLSHRSVIDEALHKAIRDQRDLHIDAGGLTFLDVGGVRLLIDAAAVLALDGRRLVISKPQPVVMRSLRICGWESAGNITVITAGNAAASEGHGPLNTEPQGVL